MAALLDCEVQCAALPVRRKGGRTEVLLVSSRQTRRWVIPKGWPMKGLSNARSAAREALEEAGIEGVVASASCGSFHYDKRRKDGSLLPCAVEVYRMDNVAELDDWPEKDQRTRQWVEAGRAAELVAEPELADLIRGLR
jgi:8-oxo-dGTP pyrophosphatase MutT (NUDIX family)